MTGKLSDSIAIFLATGMYLGYSPFAPGTLGSLIGVLLCFFLSSAGPVSYGITVLAGFLIAIWAAGKAKDYFGIKDPSHVVCDEVVGYMVAFSFIPFTVLNTIIVFLLFRFFDIVKPFPIDVIDRKMNTGLGIVLDDIVAGLYSNIAFRLIALFII